MIKLFDRIFFILKLILILLIILFFFYGCNTSSFKDNTQQEIMYYKTINVKVISVQPIYHYYSTHKFLITVRSEEYGLEESYEEGISGMTSSEYGYECFHGEIKEGNTIKAILYSWKIGDTITRRELGELVKE